MPPILRLAKAETLECQIRRRQLKLLGHVLRKDASDADRLCCFQPNTPLQPCVPPGCRRRVGRPRLVWAETILPVCERFWNLSRIQILQLAQNRTGWHSATERLCKQLQPPILLKRLFFSQSSHVSYFTSHQGSLKATFGCVCIRSPFISPVYSHLFLPVFSLFQRAADSYGLYYY